MSAELVPLDQSEAQQLERCESTIRSGLRTFVEVGKALAEIRDGKLYRQTHTTFEAYCEQEWQLSRTRAYELIGSARTVEAMSGIPNTPLPVNEGQANELSGLEPETAGQVMQVAAESGKVTAASIAEAREQVAPKPSRFTKLTNTETVLVDRETGEVVADPREFETSGMDEFAPDPLTVATENDPDWKRVNFQAMFARDLAKAGKEILTYNVAEVAEFAEPEQLDSLDELVRSYQNFAAEARRRRSGLRLVKGLS